MLARYHFRATITSLSRRFHVLSEQIGKDLGMRGRHHARHAPVFDRPHVDERDLKGGAGQRLPPVAADDGHVVAAVDHALDLGPPPIRRVVCLCCRSYAAVA